MKSEKTFKVLAEACSILSFNFIEVAGDDIHWEGMLPLPWQQTIYPVGITLAEIGEHKHVPRLRGNFDSLTHEEILAKVRINEETMAALASRDYSIDSGDADDTTHSPILLHNPQAKDIKINLFGTMLAFLQQKILTPVRQSPPRSFRRRAEREYRKLPVINIIKLRHLIHREGEGEHGDVEWSCQWLVRGHWRDQWYPSLNRNQPIWIAPYVKGPEDKPFKGAPRLFAVVR